MNWIFHATVGLLLTSFALILFWLNGKRKRLRELSDSEELVGALAKWEPIVLGHQDQGTLRDVKRFANRARFLTNEKGLPKDVICQLVGLIALDEIGCLGSSLRKFGDESAFEAWKSQILKALDRAGVGAEVKCWLHSLQLKHWKHYQALATLGRSQGNECDGEVKSASDPNKLLTGNEEQT